MICSGQGDTDGGHCCWVAGEVCELLDVTGPVPRCSLLVELGSWDKVHKDRRWKRAPVGLWMKDAYPGYGCGDWPQNIPAVMEAGIGLCCWRDR